MMLWPLAFFGAVAWLGAAALGKIRMGPRPVLQGRNLPRGPGLLVARDLPTGAWRDGWSN